MSELNRVRLAVLIGWQVFSQQRAHQSNNVGMSNFLQYINFSLQNFNLGNLGLSNGFNSVPFPCFTVHTFTDNAVMTMSDFFGINMIAIGHVVKDDLG